MSVLKRKVTPRDEALHPDPSPGWWEWWYFDADFDNGYVIAGTFHFGSPRPPANPDARFIEIGIYDRKGNSKLIRKRYPKEQCSASEETCDVVIGPNTYKGEMPRHRVYFSEGDQGCDLTYESMVEGCMLLEELQRQQLLGWFIAPRARVTGKLTVDGKTVDVTGEGYRENMWSSTPLSAGTSDRFHCFKLYIGDYTFFWTYTHSRRHLGNPPVVTLLAAKKDEIVAISNKADLVNSNFTTEGLPEELGIHYPQDILVKWNDPGVIEGEVKFNTKGVLVFFDLLSRFKPLQRWFAGRYVGRPAYFRLDLTYDANLKLRGEKVTGKGKTWSEFHKMV